MSMVLEEGMGVLNTRIDLATVVTGEMRGSFRHSLLISDILQTIVAVSRGSRKEFLPVLSNEDGPRSSRSPLSGWETQCWRSLIPGVCHLQRRTGEIDQPLIATILCFLCFQAYPEYLVTYLIVKPENQLEDGVTIANP